MKILSPLAPDKEESNEEVGGRVLLPLPWWISPHFPVTEGLHVTTWLKISAKAITRGRWNHMRTIIIYHNSLASPSIILIWKCLNLITLNYFSTLHLYLNSCLVSLNLWLQISNGPQHHLAILLYFPYAIHFLILPIIHFPLLRPPTLPTFLILNQQLCFFFQWENRCKLKRIPYLLIIKFTNFSYISMFLFLSSQSLPMYTGYHPVSSALNYERATRSWWDSWKYMQHVLCISIFFWRNIHSFHKNLRGSQNI